MEILEILNILRYSGIGILTFLLIIFEIKDGKLVGRTLQNRGYEYYTPSGEAVRIRHIFGNLFRIYVFSDYCPVRTRKDRYGIYFSVSANGSSEAESAVDKIFINAGNKSPEYGEQPY